MSRALAVLMLMAHIAPTLNAQATKSAEARGRLRFGLATGVAGVSLGSLPGVAKTTGSNVALAWRVGYALSPRTAIMFNGASSVYTYTASGRVRKRGFEALYPSVQYSVKPRFWVSGGAGINLDAPTFYDIRPSNVGERSFYRGFGALVSAGYEFRDFRAFAIEMQGRAHMGFNDIAQGRQRGRSLSVLFGVSR